MFLSWIQSIDWNIVAGWAALITSISAIFALLQQSKHSRITIGTELLWNLDDRFEETEKIRESRKKAALSLLNGEIVDEIDVVINFFECLGTYLHEGMLNEKMVWSLFYNPAIGYWFSCQEYISRVRIKDKSIWIYYEYLVNRLIKIEARVQRISPKKIGMSSEEIISFLKIESHTMDLMSNYHLPKKTKQK